MINTRIKTINNKDLCETFTDDNTKKLLQVETNTTYGSSVLDLIAGFNGNKPYSRFTYQEVDKSEEDYEIERQTGDINNG